MHALALPGHKFHFFSFMQKPCIFDMLDILALGSVSFLLKSVEDRKHNSNSLWVFNSQNIVVRDGQ